MKRDVKARKDMGYSAVLITPSNKKDMKASAAQTHTADIKARTKSRTG